MAEQATVAVSLQKKRWLAAVPDRRARAGTEGSGHPPGCRAPGGQHLVRRPHLQPDPAIHRGPGCAGRCWCRPPGRGRALALRPAPASAWVRAWQTRSATRPARRVSARSGGQRAGWRAWQGKELESGRSGPGAWAPDRLSLRVWPARRACRAGAPPHHRRARWCLPAPSGPACFPRPWRP